MQSEIFRRLKEVPTLVRIVIAQASRRRAEGSITEPVFEEQIRRLTREELEPKALTLLVRHLPGGRTRFIIKEKAHGTVCDLLDFAADGTSESDSTKLVAQVAQESSPSARPATPRSLQPAQPS